MNENLLRLLFAAFLLGMAAYALTTGELVMKGRFPRSESPGMFWFGVVFYSVMGCYMVLTVLLR